MSLPSKQQRAKEKRERERERERERNNRQKKERQTLQVFLVLTLAHSISLFFFSEFAADECYWACGRSEDWAAPNATSPIAMGTTSSPSSSSWGGRLPFVDGIMIGRAAWHNPWEMRYVDSAVFGTANRSSRRSSESGGAALSSPSAAAAAAAVVDPWEGRSRRELVHTYLAYAEEMLDRHGDFKSSNEGVFGWPAATMVKPLIGLFAGEPGGRRFKNAIGQGIHAAGASGHFSARARHGPGGEPVGADGRTTLAAMTAATTTGVGTSALVSPSVAATTQLPRSRIGGGGGGGGSNPGGAARRAKKGWYGNRRSLTSVLSTAMEEIPVYVLDRPCGREHDARWAAEKEGFLATLARDVRGPPGTPQTGNAPLVATGDGDGVVVGVAN
jgi:hypothetical protein